MLVAEFTDKVRRSSLDIYYKSLQKLLDSETSRLQTNQHHSLLSNKVFHSSLLACCAEVVLHSHLCTSLRFPHVVRACGIDVFDFLKVTETFVKVRCIGSRNDEAEEACLDHGDCQRLVPLLFNAINITLQCSGLPPALKRHLSSVEESILDRHCWDEGSKLCRVLAEERGKSTWPPEILKTEAREDEAAGRSRNAKAATQATPTSAAVAIFLRKLVCLSSRHIAFLCTNLGLESSMTDQVWTVFKRCLEAKVRTCEEPQSMLCREAAA